MFSPLTEVISRSPNHSGKRTEEIIYIIPHCTAVSVSAKRLGEIFQPTSKNASCNYGIGNDGKVVGVVDEENRSWCSSSAWADQRGITIETSSSNKAPYQLDAKAYEKLIYLTADIMKRRGKSRLVWIADKNTALKYVPAANEMVVLVHRWFANKACPGDWLIGKMNEYVSRVNSILSGPKSAYFEYTIQKGDSLSKIAYLYDTTVEELCAINNIANKNLIVAGQKILIPTAPADIIAPETEENQEKPVEEEKKPSYSVTCLICEEPTDLTEAEVKALENGSHIVKVCDKCKSAIMKIRG